MENSVTDLLSAYVREFEESEEATQDARKLSERDRDYRDHKQWTSAEKTTLEKRKQPVITYNRIMRKVNAMLGLEKQTRKDPRCFPRTPHEEQGAQAGTDALRFAMDQCRWDDLRSSAADNLLVEGTGIIFVGAKQSRGGIDPDIRRVAWDRYYFDPRAGEFDLSDKGYDGIVIWMSLADAKRKWPDRADVLESTWAQASQSDTYDDKPKHGLWADYKRKRVRICEHYCLTDGVWHRAVFTKGGFLEDPEPSPYLDFTDDPQGIPENPLKAVSLYVDRDNNRFGEVRGLISPQDEINKRRSKAMHLLTQRQVRIGRGVAPIASDGTSNLASVRNELAKPDGILVADKDEVEVLNTTDMARGNMEMLQEAKNEIDLMSINAALAGKNEQQMSGRAILAQQQGGMIEAATFLDRIRCLSLMVYRAAWNRIRQFWTEERWIRVTDDEQNLKFVGLNQPITALDAMARQLGVSAENFDEFAQQYPEDAARLQMFARMPQAQQVVGYDNQVSELDVDIIVDEGIDTPTVAAEQFDQLIKLASTGAVQFPPDVLIEASSLRNKDKLLEMLKSQQAVDPLAETAKQLQVEGLAVSNDKTRSETAKNMAETENKQVSTLATIHSPLPGTEAVAA